MIRLNDHYFAHVEGQLPHLVDTALAQRADNTTSYNLARHIVPQLLRALKEAYAEIDRLTELLENGDQCPT